jgi:hypothetical protein
VSCSLDGVRELAIEVKASYMKAGKSASAIDEGGVFWKTPKKELELMGFIQSKL